MSEILGQCPVCNKGNIIDREKIFQCDYVQSENDKCSFTVYKSFYHTEFTAELMKELIANKKTRIIDNLVSKEGNKFAASVIIGDNGNIALSFDNKKVDAKCPICSSGIIETSKSFLCAKYIDKECDLYISKTIANYELTEDDLKLLLNGEETPFINNFATRDGEVFNAKLTFDFKENKIKFSNTITRCPKCKAGDIKEWGKAYSCSNYKSEKSCDFTIWKEQYGGTISLQNVIDLCTKNSTKAITFRTKKDQTPYKGKLVLNEEFKPTLEIIKN